MDRESQLLAAMPYASLDERRQIVAELNDIRAAGRLHAEEARLGLVAEGVMAHLKPRHSVMASMAASDWLGDLVVEHTAADIAVSATTAANEWFRGLHVLALGDAEELTEQAHGAALVFAGAYSPQENVYRRAFLAQASKLSGFKLAKDAKDSEDDFDFQGEDEDDDKPWEKDSSRKVAIDMAGIEAALQTMGLVISDLSTEEQDGLLDGSLEINDVLIDALGLGSGYFSSLKAARDQSGDDPGSDFSDIDAADAPLHPNDHKQTGEPTKKKWNIDWAVAGGPDSTVGGWFTSMLRRVRLATLRRLAGGDAMTCSTCGDAIEKNDGEDGYHHDSGTKHDHEAQPGSSKESVRRTAASNPYTPGSAAWSSFETDPGVAGSVLRSQNSALFAGADAAYDRQDQSWFDAQSESDLAILWASVSGHNLFADPQGGWDDEVYDALADKGHKFSSVRRKSASRKTAGMSDEAVELELYMMNDGDTYRQAYVPVVKNLQKFKAKGTFNRDQAITGMCYAVDTAAKNYNQEHGSGGPWHGMFPKSVRMEVAASLVDDLMGEWELGNFISTKKTAGELTPDMQADLAKIKQIIPTIDESDWGDPWGAAMGYAFALNDFISDHGGETNATFQQAMGGSVTDSYEYQALAEVNADTPIEDLERAEQLLDGLLDKIRAAGLDY